MGFYGIFKAAPFSLSLSAPLSLYFNAWQLAPFVVVPGGIITVALPPYEHLCMILMSMVSLLLCVLFWLLLPQTGSRTPRGAMSKGKDVHMSASLFAVRKDESVRGHSAYLIDFFLPLF